MDARDDLQAKRERIEKALAPTDGEILIDEVEVDPPLFYLMFSILMALGKDAAAEKNPAILLDRIRTYGRPDGTLRFAAFVADAIRDMIVPVGQWRPLPPEQSERRAAN